jgi:ATP-dependent RNA helicase DeaD
VDLLKDLQPVQALIFCHSRFQVEKVCQALQRQLHGVDFLHAGLTQDIRSIVTSKFRSQKIRYLVATDVVARGLDFSKVSHVFIYQLPDEPEIYLHRSGRTGRWGKEGLVISFVTPREMSHLRRVSQHLKQEPIWLGEPPPSKTEKMEAPAKPYRRKPPGAQTK